jgi:hypothetical protein
MRPGAATATLIALCIAGLLSATASATELCVECEWQILQDAIANDDLTTAVAHFKELREQHPDRQAPILLLASAYHADDNSYWAMNVLYEWYNAHPGDCEVLSFIIWEQIQAANVDGARELMARSDCPNDNNTKSRWHLIDAYLNTIDEKQPDVSRSLDRAWPEDVVLWETLWEQDAPGRRSPLDIYSSLEAGYTSNAQAGSPLESSEEKTQSIAGRLEIQTRFTMPTGTSILPVLGVTGRFNGLTASEVHKFSYIDLAYSPGLLIGRNTTLQVSYKGNLMLMAWPGKEVFHETHRLEMELTSPSGLLLFAGAGRRIYNESGRTRWEVDGGFGQSLMLNSFTTLLFGLNGRYYDAIGDPYDQAGAGLLAAAHFKLPHEMAMRSGVSESMDFFFHSGGERGGDAYGLKDEKRRDITMRHFDEIWLWPFGNIKLGLRYEFNVRDSRADKAHNANNYDYNEHRIMLKITWSQQINPFAPRATDAENHVPLDYGLSKAQAGQDINSREIADMLRADEAARAASSCVE